jgi:subfamily B ATP-binding cassette protein MsbA
MAAASTLSDPEPAAAAAATIGVAPSPPDAPPLRRDGLRGVARRLTRYLRPHRATLIVAVVLFFASSAIDPLVPALFKWLLDNGFKPNVAFPIAAVPVAIVGIFTVRGALAFGGAYLFARATADVVLALRNDLVGAVMRAEASLFSNLSPGVAAHRVISDP